MLEFVLKEMTVYSPIQIYDKFHLVKAIRKIYTDSLKKVVKKFLLCCLMTALKYFTLSLH